MSRAASADVAVPWLLVGAGFTVMYGPSYWAALEMVWQSDDVAHGPLMLAVVLWAAWQLRHRIAAAPAHPSPVAGVPLFAAGLLLYAAARVFSILSAEFASQILVVAGCALLLRGPGTLRAAWFPVLYLLFTVPLPASFVDAVTAPLKEWISVIVVDLIYALGYPIARAGVTISIGAYQLLVADACSGLNSMFGLTAIGVLFMFMMNRKSRLHNAIVLVSILPIAFGANIVRVMSLVLITYKFGDDAGQGFLHGAAGLSLFVVALVMLFLLDAAVAALLGRKGESGTSIQASRT
jgi:exosortase B